MSVDVDAIAQTILRLSTGSGLRPFIVGVCGAPATGKSTLAQALADILAKRDGLSAVNCPIDGFHLRNRTLDALGIRRFKGRLDTYDTEGLIASVRRLRQPHDGFFWPLYSRVLHEPVPEGVFIEKDTDIAIIEGNYIFSDDHRWRGVRDLLDYKLFLKCPEDVLRERLLQRHIAGGRSPEDALAKIAETDLPNAHVIAMTQSAADLVVTAD